MSSVIHWKPAEAYVDPDDAIISAGGRFLIVDEGDVYRLIDKAGNQPPNPGECFASEAGAKSFARALIETGQRI